MLGAMLIGAWLLIHQCCAIGEKESELRNSFLVEQLTRRSNLEKNFMRFGRSSGFSYEPQDQPDTDLYPNEVKRVKDTSNYFRLGRAKTMRDNFIRFGKREGQEFKKLAELNMKFSQVPNNEEFSRSARGDDDGYGGALEDFYRPMRAKTDFMRLGRSSADDKLPKPGSPEEYPVDEEKEKRYNENLKMRFGRGVSMNRDARGRTDFMRFGRDGEQKPEATTEESSGLTRFDKENSKEEERGPNSGDKHGGIVGGEDKHEEREGWRLCSGDDTIGKKVCRTAKNVQDRLNSRLGRSLPSPFQPGFILGPELALLPPIYYKQPSVNSLNNMMRLG